MLAPAYAVFVVPAVNAPDAGLKVIAGFTVMDEVVTVLVVSVILVAVTVTLEAVELFAVNVVEGVLPVALDGLTEPAPVVAKLAPEALESFATAATSESVWPESSTIPVVGVVKEMPMPLSVIVDADETLLGSVTLVAEIDAEVTEPMTAGAV